MKFSVLGCLLATAFSVVRAAPIAPQELADKAAQGFRLLSLAEGAEPVWKTEEEKLELLRAKVHFVSPRSPCSHRRMVLIFAIVRRYGSLRA